MFIGLFKVKFKSRLPITEFSGSTLHIVFMFLLTDGDIHRIPCNIGAETFRDSFIRLKKQQGYPKRDETI